MQRAQRSTLLRHLGVQGFVYNAAIPAVTAISTAINKEVGYASDKETSRD